jgi:uncharacterized low-complexity protein
MKTALIAAGLAGAALLAGATFAVAEDNEAGVPLTATEAAGNWTVASQGQDLCVLTMGAAHTVRAPASCRDAIPGAPVGWQPTKDGMELVDSGGKTVIAFHRWSNSLFVSHRSSGVDLQLRRGG